MGLGALVWLLGNVLWLAGRSIPHVALWWTGFLVLTIIGERLELSRLLRLSQADYAAFLLATGLFLVGVILTEVDVNVGTRFAGAGMLALTVWLLRHDIARRTVHQSGLARFTALCLLSDYVWLGVSGLLELHFGGLVAGPRYDAMLRSLFLGFVLAMIFGHAPIIFPAVLGLPIIFLSTFYAHLILLHLSLALRIMGDLLPWWAARQWGGLLKVVVVLLFLANTAYSMLRPADDLAIKRT